MKKIHVFYILDVILIIIFFLLALKESFTRKVGLAALESAGRFCLYGILCISVLLLLVLVLLMNEIIKKRKGSK